MFAEQVFGLIFSSSALGSLADQFVFSQDKSRIPKAVEKGSRLINYANYWISCMRTNRLIWYLKLVSVNEGSSNSARIDKLR